MDKVADIQKKLNDAGICADAYLGGDGDIVAVDIRWGDWKHSHARAKWVLADYHHLRTEITEEDGSDTYSAIHYFR